MFTMQRHFHPYQWEGRTMMTISIQIHIGLFMYQELFLLLLLLLLLSHFSHVQLCAISQTAAHHPWDSLGKNTRVGCHCLLQCMKVKNESEVAQSCPTQWPHGLQPTKLLRPWDFPGKSTGMGCHCLLCNEILLRHKKKWNWVICSNVDGLESVIQSEIS